MASWSNSLSPCSPPSLFLRCAPPLPPRPPPPPRPRPLSPPPPAPPRPRARPPPLPRKPPPRTPPPRGPPPRPPPAPGAKRGVNPGAPGGGLLKPPLPSCAGLLRSGLGVPTPPLPPRPRWGKLFMLMMFPGRGTPAGRETLALKPPPPRELDGLPSPEPPRAPRREAASMERVRRGKGEGARRASLELLRLLLLLASSLSAQRSGVVEKVWRRVEDISEAVFALALRPRTRHAV